MTLATLIDAFLAHGVRQNWSRNTARAYGDKLRHLRAALGAAPPDRQTLLHWLHEQTHWGDHEPKSGSTQAAYRAVLSALFAFALAEDLLPTHPLKPQDLKRPRIAQRDTVPTAAETQSILDLAPLEWSLIYRVLRLTGARPSELTAARIEWIQETDQGRTLHLEAHKTRHETGQARLIPFGAQVWPAVATAIGPRRFGPIFLNSRQRPWQVGQVSRIFRELRNQLGLSPNLVLYSTRHEFGSAVTKQHGIHAAQVLLGHRSIKTTQRYAHLTTAELATLQATAIQDPIPGTT